MEYTRNIGFNEEPDYKMLQGLFDRTFIEMGFTLDDEFCWHIKRRSIIEAKL